MTVIPFPTSLNPAEALAQETAGSMWKLLYAAMQDGIDTGDAVKDREEELFLMMRCLELTLQLAAQDILLQNDINAEPSAIDVYKNCSLIARELMNAARLKLRKVRRYEATH